MDSAESSKSEREKAVSGELYNPMDPELLQLRKKSRQYQRRFNESTEEEDDIRDAILQDWLGFKGQGMFIEPPFFCDYGCNVRIGEQSCFNFDCVILDTCSVEIGAHVKIGPKVQIYTATHPLDAAERTKPPGFLEFGKPVKIGNNVWLSGGCIICPGVTIGDNTTIGAGSVVTKNIPANVVAAGNPARVIRELPPPPTSDTS